MNLTKKYKWWLVWGVSSAILVALLSYFLLAEDKSLYLSGPMTSGHYQIGVKCDACHQSAFAGDEGIQRACVKCHQQALEQSDDSHPKSKFTDPRNADRVAKLDARYCATCHEEHAPERTFAMGVTLPSDYCILCHKDVGKDRPSHVGLKFDSCASAGCHNFHNNRALYEDFLVEHAGKPDILPAAVVPMRNDYLFRKTQPDQRKSLTAVDQDGPAGSGTPETVQHWAASAHAREGVNCSDCHRQGARAWTDRPGLGVCTDCHAMEMKTFKESRHGMRLAVSLPPMRPAMARQPMKTKAADKTMDCNACHRPHAENTSTAAVDSCLACHDDKHSRAYKASPHYRLWQKEKNGTGVAGSGVSCATCHLPRENHPDAGRQRIRVQHNPNHNLRPNEKMIRGVCMQCHGLAFSIDALADARLIETNFSGKPGKHIPSIDWAIRRVKPKSK